MPDEGNPYDPDWVEEGSDDFFGESDEHSEQDSEDEAFGDAMGELLAHYEEEQEEFNEAEAEFTDKYGFVHKCRCAEDWAQGNLGVVSVCYLNMVSDAMETLENAIKELRELKRENAKLRINAASA